MVVIGSSKTMADDLQRGGVTIVLPNWLTAWLKELPTVLVGTRLKNETFFCRLSGKFTSLFAGKMQLTKITRAEKRTSTPEVSRILPAVQVDKRATIARKPLCETVTEVLRSWLPRSKRSVTPLTFHIRQLP